MSTPLRVNGMGVFPRIEVTDWIMHTSKHGSGSGGHNASDEKGAPKVALLSTIGIAVKATKPSLTVSTCHVLLNPGLTISTFSAIDEVRRANLQE